MGDLKPGMRANIGLSPADEELARSITVEPPTPEPETGKKETK